ncbi:excinuclease ABC subunit C [Moorena producens PAL-8-15-08-1]|uniref:UvrABC system protein C n=1 Tax=Moorena producens PAL-8-15-08-1 TaxID=1458985 RepID=A0A1D8TUU5_9CYAN|nr:excinuclease ABC subunit UvrC [Moorena producens]AOX01419.1 excinuclease ABC subunit C [Moorena producens PAL-8-15-08-1]
MSSKPLIQDPEPLESRLKEIPLEPGVYLMRDHSASILYIGKSRKLRTRVRSYFRYSQPLSPRIAMMVGQVTDIEFIVTDTEAEALALEANLIKQHQPYYNVLLKDDKKYPYVAITWSEDYPRIFITRKRRMGNKHDKYYGPYVDVKLLRNTLALVKQVFPIRQRPKPLFKDRPCLNYDLGRCPGVCQKLITPEEYRQTIQEIAMVFQGRTGELIEMLTANMEQAAESLNFELAARIRDQITGLKSLSTDQKVALPDDTVSRDAIALAADAKHACIQLFQIRAGHLVGRLGFFADVAPQGNGPIELGAILQRVLEEHYQTADAVEIPTEILVQHPLPDGEMLADYLSLRKGRNVTILTPQRQTKAELIEMVKRNANYELERTQRLVDRNTKAMEDLANILDLPDLPRRIEGYDISHIQGSNAVASQVVFLDGTSAKQHYRHYKIKNPNITVGHSDDFASLAEVIRRRFRKSQLEPEPADSISSTINNQHSTLRKDWPDLVMIDGGKGQLSAVVAVLQELNLQEEVPVVSLAKQYEELFLPEQPFPLNTEPEQPGVQLLRRVRDEAHRFAVNFHRKQRTTQLHRSRLDEIPGLGFQRQKQLLAHFNSIDYIRNASVKQLAEVPGIGLHLSKEIYHYFHP